MRTSAWSLVLAGVVLVSACSGGRGERLSCTNISECSSDDVCLNGFCTETSEARVSARASAVGADATVLVIDALGKTCEASACEELPYGSPVTFRAGEVAGFRFTGWTGSPGCGAATPELRIPALMRDTECIANYVRRLRVAGHVAGGEGGVTASSESAFASCQGGLCEVDVGASVKLVAEDRFGERFVSWSGPGCGEAKTLETIVTAVDADLRCAANFIPRVSVAGRAMNAEVTIEVTAVDAVCEPGSCLLDQGGSATLSAPPVSGFRFAGWSGSSACVGVDPVLTLSPLHEAQLCLATYMPRVKVSGSSAGAVPPPAVSALSSDLYAVCSGPACETDKNGAVTLLASSANGYRLTGWTGPQCDAETGAALELTEVTSDLACVANYVQGIAVIGAVVGAPGEVTASSTTPSAQCTGGGCIIDVGGNATLTAPSIPGYRFLGWDGDAGCTGASDAISFEQVSTSHTCYARFATRFLVRGLAAPAEGGTVRASSSSTDAVCTAAACTLDGGGAVTLEAVPLADYRFSGWSGGGACTGSAPAVTVSDTRGNVTCQANFVGRVHVVGVAAPEGSGSVVAQSDSAAATCAAATCQIDQGSRVAFTATPATGFRFTGWSDCSTAAEPLLTLEGIRRGALCQANFVPLRFTVASSVTPPDTGSVVASAREGAPACGNGHCTVNYGSDVTLRAIPSTGYRFVSWRGCVESNAPTITVSDVTADASCQVTFERIILTVSASASAGGAVSARSTTPGASCQGARCTVPYGGRVVLTATAQAGHRFTAWSCVGSDEPSLTLQDLTGNASCEASFERLRFTLTGTAAPTGGGAIEARSSTAGASCKGASCSVDFGGTVTLSAVPARGFVFLGWTGCQTSTDAVLNFVDIRANAACHAHFEPLRFVVTGVAAPADLGSVRASSPAGDAGCADNRCEVSFGSSVTLTPIAVPGARFVGFSSCPIAGDGPITLTSVEAAVTCQANFERLAYLVRGVAQAGGTIAGAVGTTPCPDAACTVAHGGSASFTAAPSAGFAVAGWTGCTPTADGLGASVGNVTAAATCTVRFERLVYAVRGTTLGGGSISGSSGGVACAGAVCDVPFGGSATFTAGADTAQVRFTGFGGACTPIPGNPRAAIVDNVSAPATCTAQFGAATYPVQGSATGGGSIRGSTGGTQCAGALCAVVFGGSAVFTASEDSAALRLLGFSGACTELAGDPRSAIVQDVVGPATCTANFAGNSYTVSGRATNNGAITGSTAAGVCPGASCSVPFGGSATFTADDTDSAVFVSFGGACVATGPRSATVDPVGGNAECIANFDVRTVTVTTSVGQGRGTVSTSCQNATCVLAPGTQLTLTAVAAVDDGLWPQEFLSWTGEGCPGTRAASFAFSADRDLSCVANFQDQLILQ